MIKVRTALTVPGKGKEVCQDVVKVEELKGFTNAIVFALADGAGSAPRGKEGAEFLVSKFVEVTKNKLNILEHPQKAVLCSLFLLSEVTSSLKTARSGLINSSISKGVHPEDMHSTFIGGILLEDHFGKSLLTYVSVGDSVLIVMDDELKVIHSNAITLGEYPNTTVFVTSPEFDNVVTGGIVENPKLVLVSSDGLDNIFFSQRLVAEGDESLPYYNRFLWEVEPFPNLARFIRKIRSEELSLENLKTFLSSGAVSEYNTDDKSLILIEVKDVERSNEIGREPELVKGNMGKEEKTPNASSSHGANIKT